MVRPHTVISHESVAEMPAVGWWSSVPAEGTSAKLYKTPNLHVDQQRVILDMPPTSVMRAPSEAPGGFALETAMDELAVAARIDPLELRLRNYATVVPGTDRAWSSKHLHDCYRIGARRFGWSARRATPRARVDGQWLIGMGMATAIYPGTASTTPSTSVSDCSTTTPPSCPPQPPIWAPARGPCWRSPAPTPWASRCTG